MYNAAAFLSEGRFVPPAEARSNGAPKPTLLTLTRKDGRGNVCQFYVTDNVEVLRGNGDWCVFALSTVDRCVPRCGDLKRVSFTIYNTNSAFTQASRRGSLCARA